MYGSMYACMYVCMHACIYINMLHRYFDFQIDIILNIYTHTLYYITLHCIALHLHFIALRYITLHYIHIDIDLQTKDLGVHRSARFSSTAAIAKPILAKFRLPTHGQRGKTSRTNEDHLSAVEISQQISKEVSYQPTFAPLIFLRIVGETHDRAVSLFSRNRIISFQVWFYTEKPKFSLYTQYSSQTQDFRNCQSANQRPSLDK